MVQKSQKRGVHSGNTLRASDCRYNRRYRRQSYLIRSIKGIESDTILDDLDITSDDIQYSLNKKARWTIPQILKEHIILKKHHHSEPKLQMTEQHRLKRNNNCIGYFATQGLIRKVIPRRKAYFNVGSLRPKRNKVRAPVKPHATLKPVNNETPFSDVPSQKESEIVPEINVDVFYPSPISSSITHNPKYIRPESCAPSPETQNQSKQKKTNRQKHRIKCNTNNILSRCETMYDEFDDYVSVEEVDDDDDDDDLKQYIYSTSSTKHDTFTAADVLQYARQMNIMNPSSTGHQTNTLETEEDEKRRQNYVQRSDHKDNTKDSITTRKDVSNYTKQLFPPMEPVQVLLSREETRPEYLKFIYDDRYVECKSFPRSFVIDISQDVRSAAYNFQNIRDQYYKTDFTSCLVFTYDMFTDIYDQGDCDVFNVYLNTAIKQESIRVETLFDFFHGSIDEIIQRVCFFFETFEAESFYTLPKLPVAKGKTGFDALKSSQESSVDAYCVNHGSAYREIFKEDSCVINDISAHGFESVPPTICYICFESIGNGQQNAIALETCGHWFCQTCWHEHVQNRLQNGSLQMTCPEYECKEMVKLSVLLQIVNIRQIEKHIKRTHDVSITRDDNTKWCPNPRCGCVIKATKHVKYMNITCKCGTEVCFDCLQYPHWPASCELSNQYLDDLKKKGYIFELKPENTKTVRVRGKKCPQCNQFIEKDGGCFSMNCVCGASFCWGCLTPWNRHVYTPLCDQNRYSDKHNTTSQLIRHEDSLTLWESRIESRYLKNAVSNRSARRKHKVAKLKAGVRDLMRRSKYFGRKNEARLLAELSEYTIPGKETATLEEKLSSFLKSMVLLYIEMHHLGEYTSVYLPQAKGRLRQSLWDIVGRLESLASRISDKLQLNVNEDPSAVINDLIEIRSYSRKTVEGLVKIIDH